MTMPFFEPDDDPGSNFPNLLRRIGLYPDALGGAATAPSPGLPGAASAGASGTSEYATPHATTCVAMRYNEGVVMAGDRRVTAGNLISHRAAEKIVEADRYSGVAFAGAAGPAVEMVRLFQLQLEHYEKVEGAVLSLEGKANQLSMMIRGNLPAAMQGLAVVPIFAGYDPRNGEGRLWAFDVTGGRYEERDHVATGSGSLHAETVVKIGYRSDLARDEAIALACKAIWEAADADSATGGPDPLRGIYPIVATVNGDGFVKAGDDELATTFEAVAEEVRSR